MESNTLRFSINASPDEAPTTENRRDRAIWWGVSVALLLHGIVGVGLVSFNAAHPNLFSRAPVKARAEEDPHVIVVSIVTQDELNQMSAAPLGNSSDSQAVGQIPQLDASPRYETRMNIGTLDVPISSPKASEKKKILDKTVVRTANGKTTAVSEENKANPSSAQIREEVRQGQSQSEGARGGGGTTSANVNALTYQQKIAAQVAQQKRYPSRARQRGIEGNVIIELTVRKDGSVVLSQVLSSESQLLTEGVDSMIERAAPFPVIPEELHTNEVTLQIPIRFSLH